MRWWANPVRKEVNKFFDSKPKFSYVQILPENIRPFAEKMIDKKIKLPKWRDNESAKGVFVDDDKDAYKFFTIINSINFCFWNLETRQDGTKNFQRYTNDTGHIGSNEMYAIVKKHLEILEPSYLERITVNEMKSFFGNLSLIKERTKIFNEIGRVFKEKGITFKDYFYQTNKLFDEGEGLVELIVKDFPSFQDKTRGITLWKRAQLLPAQLYERLGPQKVPFKDIDEETVFADYQVPKGLQQEEIIKYSPYLLNKINNYEIIKKNSVMELEIRVCTVKASDLIVKELHEMGQKNANCLHVDSFLWHYARANEMPYHLTKTTAY